MAIFIAETLKIAQVPVSTLSKSTVAKLRTQASYIDVDTTLNEFLVSVDTIGELAKNETDIQQELNALFKEVANYQYVAVIAI